MAFIATLRGIFKFSEVPEDMGPYVQFKAAIDKREGELDDSVEIAILNISGTGSSHVLFLDSYENTDEIVQELKDADAKINHTSLNILKKHLTSSD